MRLYGLKGFHLFLAVEETTESKIVVRRYRQ